MNKSFVNSSFSTLAAAQKQLPFLPGNSFDDPWLKEKHHKRQVFDYKNGLVVVKDLVVPEEIMTSSQVATAAQQLATLKLQESMKSEEIEETQPKWLSLDRKVLRFYAYFKEGVHESNQENARVRRCVVYYYLEDDTVYVSEPRQDNSGIPQGALIKRHRVPIPGAPNQYYTLEAFNVGTEVTLYGKTFRIVDCDDFTRAFLQGIGTEVPPPEDYPNDQYGTLRADLKKTMNPKNILKPEDQHLKRYLEYSFKGRHTNPSKQEQAEIQQFLKKDREVLRFYCTWDDRGNLYGDQRFFVLEYYLADDKIKISENYPNNSGRDPFPVFIKKQKIPKASTPGTPVEYYTEEDLAIGRTIVAFSKKFLMYDCDEFTKDYYRKRYGVEDFTPVDVKIKSAAPVKIEPPEYNGYGTEEDSLGSWKYLVMKPPKKDVKKYMQLDKHMLRFGAVMDTVKPEDIERKFIVTYYLADDTISIFEPAQRNSGIIGGKFLQRQRVKAPDGNYFKPEDFYVGAVITINSHKFILNQTDEHTVRYMESMPKQFSMSDINTVIKKLRELLYSRHARVRDAFREIDTDHSGTITIEELRELLNKLNIHISEQEIITVMRYFDQDRDGEITFNEFKETVFPMSMTIKESEIKDEQMLASGSHEEAKIKNAQAQRDKHNKMMQAFKKFKQRVENRRLLFQDTFRIMSDRSIDSNIGEQEFRKAVGELMQMNFSEEEVQLLVEYCFPPARKRISYNDFLKIVEGTSTWQLAYNH